MAKKKVSRVFKVSPKKVGPQRKVHGKTEFVPVLMKLRLGLSNDFLCDLLDISQGSCSQILNTWVRFLATDLKPLVFWPDGVITRKMLPTGLASKYPLLRCTLDCTELFITRPRHLELQALTWSDYKKHNTAKYLIAIAPKGPCKYKKNPKIQKSLDTIDPTHPPLYPKKKKSGKSQK